MSYDLSAERRVIYHADDVTVTVGAVASAAALALLRETVYGTSGPQYVHFGQEEKVRRIREPYFFDLAVAGVTVGTYCLSRRLVQTPGGVVPGFYGRYLAVAPAHGGRGYGQRLKTEAVRYVEGTTPGPHVFYSYVEEANHRSAQISARAGFTSVATLEALVFSRFYPRRDARFAPLPAAERPAMLVLLQTAYADYSLTQFDYLYEGQNYFVLREAGQIVAGVQANPTRWRIVAMPGVSGQLLLRVLPHVPVLKRLLNPKNYQFAALEALYVRPGHEAALPRLLESVLAYFGFTSALLMTDVNSPIGRQLKESGQLGLMNALKQPIYSRVLVKANGLPLAAVESTARHPVYTSAFDYT